MYEKAEKNKLKLAGSGVIQQIFDVKLKKGFFFLIFIKRFKKSLWYNC
jgi:hypothetical protein